MGRFETKARLVVHSAEKPKKAPEFVEKLGDKTEVEGGSVVFEVRVEAEPKATISWTLNGKKLEESDVSLSSQCPTF